MESFSAIDIFDTKGTEYLFVIGYLLILIVFWRLMSKPVSLMQPIKNAVGVLSDRVLKIPQGVFFSKNHTWAYLDQSGEAQVGLDSLLQNITGEVNFLSLIDPGKTIKKGETLTEIEHNGKKLKVTSPISGEILNVNPLINQGHEEVRRDVYGKYWVYKIKPSNWVEDTKSFYLAEDASKWIKKELDRFKDFLAESMSKHLPQTQMYALQEGGELRGDTLSELPGEIWEDFQKNFLDES